jgi:hypothetical protein
MGKSDKGTTGNHVYIMHKEYAWIPALLLEQGKDEAKVSIPQYSEEAKILTDGGHGSTGYKDETIKLKHYPGKVIPLANVDKGGMLIEKEDMVDLPYLHEVRVMDGLSCRCCLVIILSVIYPMAHSLTFLHHYYTPGRYFVQLESPSRPQLAVHTHRRHYHCVQPLPVDC